MGPIKNAGRRNCRMTREMISKRFLKSCWQTFLLKKANSPALLKVKRFEECVEKQIVSNESNENNFFYY